MGRELQSSIVTKCATLLDQLSESPDPLTFSEIVDRSGYNKSSVHRIIAVLMGEELVSFDTLTKTYHLGSRPMRWARAAWQKTDLQLITDAELIQLRNMTGMNVAVSIRTEDSVMYIRTMDVRSVRYAAKIGQQAPLHATAAGKLFLAHDEDQARCGLPDGYDMEKLTEYTITAKGALKTELKRIRKAGYARCDREEFLQISGIAAPVFDYQSNIIAAISLWAPSKLASLKTVESHAANLLDAASAISARFGAMVTDTA